MKPKSYTRFEIDNQKTKSEFKFCKNQKFRASVTKIPSGAGGFEKKKNARELVGTSRENFALGRAPAGRV